MPFTLTVHHSRVNKKGQRVIVKETPYKTFSNGMTRIYVQDGGVYYENGERLEDPPRWLWEAYAHTTPEKRKKLGVELPEEFEITPVKKADRKKAA